MSTKIPSASSGVKPAYVETFSTNPFSTPPRNEHLAAIHSSSDIFGANEASLKSVTNAGSL